MTHTQIVGSHLRQISKRRFVLPVELALMLNAANFLNVAPLRMAVWLASVGCDLTRGGVF